MYVIVHQRYLNQSVLQKRLITSNVLTKMEKSGDRNVMMQPRDNLLYTLKLTIDRTLFIAHLQSLRYT